MKLHFVTLIPPHRPPYIAVELTDGEVHGSIEVENTDDAQTVLAKLQQIMADMEEHKNG